MVLKDAPSITVQLFGGSIRAKPWPSIPLPRTPLPLVFRRAPPLVLLLGWPTLGPSGRLPPPPTLVVDSDPLPHHVAGSTVQC